MEPFPTLYFCRDFKPAPMILAEHRFGKEELLALMDPGALGMDETGAVEDPDGVRPPPDYFAQFGVALRNLWLREPQLPMNMQVNKKI